MEITFKLSKKDFVKFYQSYRKKMASGVINTMYILIVLVPTVGLMFFAQFVENPGAKKVMLALGFLMSISLIIYGILCSYLCHRKVKNSYNKDDISFKIIIDKSLFKIKSDYSTTSFNKPFISNIDEDEKFYFLYTKSNSCIFIPKTSIKDAEIFVNLINSFKV